MSTLEVTEQRVIEFDLIDRLYKSLRLAGLKPIDMANHLGLHRNTVSGWLRGKAGMNKATLIAWAAKCSETSPIPITFEWLTENIAQCGLSDETPADQGRLLDNDGLAVRFDYHWLRPVTDLASRRAS